MQTHSLQISQCSFICSTTLRCLHVLNTLIESLKLFDKTHIHLVAFHLYKTSKVKVCGLASSPIPQESMYEAPLRILSNWLQQYGWMVTGQWHGQMKHKYSDIIIKKDNPTIVLELLATGDQSFVRSHIQNTPEHMALLPASEAWVIHFTCEEDYNPIWQSGKILEIFSKKITGYW